MNIGDWRSIFEQKEINSNHQNKAFFPMSTLIIFLMEEAVEKTNEPGLARSMAEIGRMGVFPVLKKKAFLNFMIDDGRDGHDDDHDGDCDG